MGSTASATLAVPLRLKAPITMSSACAISGHCIGNAMEYSTGKQDIILRG